MDAELILVVDGEEHRLEVDTRTTLLDALREHRVPLRQIITLGGGEFSMEPGNLHVPGV
jgi:hypothetical protein